MKHGKTWWSRKEGEGMRGGGFLRCTIFEEFAR